MDDTVKYKNYIFKKYILHKDIISRIKDVANCINEEYSHIAATSKEKPVFLGVYSNKRVILRRKHQTTFSRRSPKNGIAHTIHHTFHTYALKIV